MVNAEVLNEVFVGSSVTVFFSYSTNAPKPTKATAWEVVRIDFVWMSSRHLQQKSFGWWEAFWATASSWTLLNFMVMSYDMVQRQPSENPNVTMLASVPLCCFGCFCHSWFFLKKISQVKPLGFCHFLVCLCSQVPEKKQHAPQSLSAKTFILNAKV